MVPGGATKANIKARVRNLKPKRTVPILQNGVKKSVKNGMVVYFTEQQYIAALVEAPIWFTFQCPSCKHYYDLLYNISGTRKCLDCIEWRPSIKKPKQRRH